MSEPVSPLAITPGLSSFLIAASPEYVKKKADLLEAASCVFVIGDDDDEEAAILVARRIKGLEKEVEDGRETIKKPILIIGRDIDAKAKEFAKELVEARVRIEKLLSERLAEKRRILAAAQEEERKAMAKQQAEEAARQAEVEALASALGVEPPEPAPSAAPAPVALNTPKPTIAGGVMRVSLDFEVTDIKALYAALPWLVKMEVNRANMIAYLNGGACVDPEKPGSVPGVTVFRKDKFSARAATTPKTIDQNPFE